MGDRDGSLAVTGLQERGKVAVPRRLASATGLGPARLVTDEAKRTSAKAVTRAERRFT